MKRLLSSLLILLLAGCAYYNTFYNAEEYFKAARKATRANQSSQVTREETQLYAKAIEKSKKVLQNYPDSKYRDDAQFIIAQSYFYRQDYGIAEKYFEELAREFPTSPYSEEVPLWIARCLSKRGDLEMARHEAGRIIRTSRDSKNRAQAYLLMGEIALARDSLDAARGYLEQVVSTSRDGLVRAQAQYQIGNLLEQSGDYTGALAAYERVTRYKPSESLKVQAIIQQMDMLKLLDRDAEAQTMIETMLLDDKFVDIRGQLEVELGKLYLEQERYSEAESRFDGVLENYAGQQYAAQAAYHLAEYRLFQERSYGEALKSYNNVGQQYRRSPLKSLADARVKQIQHYVKLQGEYENLTRQLAGLSPKEKNRRSNNSTRSRSSTRGRGRTSSHSRTTAEQPQNPTPDREEEEERVAVSAEDSLRFMNQICENRYTLAEYMLFEFQDVDTTLAVMDSLRKNCTGGKLAQQAAYMQYYIHDVVRPDSLAAAAALALIRERYPDYYQSVTASQDAQASADSLAGTVMEAAAAAFEADDFERSIALYDEVRLDTTFSTEMRAASHFRIAWLLDHYALEQRQAIDEYRSFMTEYPASPLLEMADRRLALIGIQDPEPQSLPADSIALDPAETSPDETDQR